VPGIKILKRKRHLRLLPKYFHTEIPEELAAEVDAADPDDVENIGVDWAIRQARELLEAGVPCIHFYIMSSADTVKKVVEPLHKHEMA
jgi:methylenetetrahydrofolate reductase (NADPH)